MKYLLYVLLVAAFSANAQNPIPVAKAVNNSYEWLADTAALRKALQQTLGDGTQITSLSVLSQNKWHYLIGSGTQKNYPKLIAIELTYDIMTRTYAVKPGMAHKTCASAGCTTCEPFRENGNIIGCHCKDAGTVSNECNFKTVTNSPFYDQAKRYLKLPK